MKAGIHSLITLLAKPVFAGSLLLWTGLLLNFGIQVVTGASFGEEVGQEVSRHPTETVTLILFMLVALGFIKMSWDGMLYWPKRKPSFRFEMKRPQPDENLND